MVNDAPNVQNEEEIERLSDLNNDLLEVWGSSQKSIGDLPQKAFEYDPSVQKRSGSKMAVFLSKNIQGDSGQKNFTGNYQPEPQLLFAPKEKLRNQKQRQFSMETAGFNPDHHDPSSNRSHMSGLQNKTV